MASSKVMASANSAANSELAQQPSYCSLAIPELQADPHRAKNFESTTMDYFLKNIYGDSATSNLSPDSSPVPSSAADNDGVGEMSGTGAGNRALDEVWRDIVAGGADRNSETEVTLEDFLARAGAVGEEDVRVPTMPSLVVPPPAKCFGVDVANSMMSGGTNQFQSQLTAPGFGNGGGGVRGKRRSAEDAMVDKATQQKQRRMIKNRESAARSRERKQAYTVELEELVTHLEEENALLDREEAVRTKERFQQLVECVIPVTEKRRPRRALRRVRSMSLKPSSESSCLSLLRSFRLRSARARTSMGTPTASSSIAVAMLTMMVCSTSLMLVKSDASDHRYKSGDLVPLYANKVGPFHNPSETYQYFDLPFCSPALVKEKKEALGEVLNGDRLVSALYKLDFLVDKDSEVVCNKTLTKEQVAQFRTAVDKDYYFQMYYDDLPLWGFLGKVDKEENADPSQYKYYLFRHINFEILYNKDRVIEINAQSDPNALLDLTEGVDVDVEFLYSVKWKETDKSFEKRMEKYSQSSSLPHQLQIHWFSIINSCVTVLLLTGFLATILMRVLKNDFVKYTHDEENTDDEEETGWKYIHGDVFRFPKHNSLLAAALGSGTQLFIITLFIFALALVGVFYPYNRGALFTALVVIYALTSGIAGYVATSFYCQLEGTNWVRNLLLTGCLFCGPLFMTFCFLNTVAIAYSATAALPFGTIVVIVLIWTLITAPLLVLGGIAGKNSKTDFQAPCRTTKYPREIPPLPWYRRTVPQMAMAGFLPFSAIYIELYYIFASIWGHKIYTIYSILFIVFIILSIATAFITVALTYFQLAAEDHKWWWRSFLCGGSTGWFIYCYCIYYYYARSDMSGFMQTSFFFGYMACICYGFFLMLDSSKYSAGDFFGNPIGMHHLMFVCSGMSALFTINYREIDFCCGSSWSKQNFEATLMEVAVAVRQEFSHSQRRQVSEGEAGEEKKMFLRRIARPLMAKVKETTGIVGLEVVPNAREVLISLYTKTLREIQAVPEDEGYRKAVESFTRHRLKVCQEEEDWEMIEKRLGCGQVEELIEEAEDELKLIAKMIEWDPWGVPDDYECEVIENDAPIPKHIPQHRPGPLPAEFYKTLDTVASQPNKDEPAITAGPSKD
ncbi:hypothetical protein Nepgr_028664 [Nepenthes gracilis]|uniref:BZIP domain-containing protein n=1 Tax=Nepenthes gracilis TaxID=150966 RepID=A0AAD3Y4T0_NEPGR|nr:hypothetical protein Nepgr_028664 [Nepenthes gracilis]